LLISAHSLVRHVSIFFCFPPKPAFRPIPPDRSSWPFQPKPTQPGLLPPPAIQATATGTIAPLHRAPSLAFLPQSEEDQPKRWVAAFIFPTEITPSHLTYVLYHFKTEAFNPHCAGDRLLSPPPPLRPYKRYLHLAILNHIALPSSTSLSRAPRKLSSQGSHRHVGSSPLALPHC
jgi:hypothetical protein